MRRQIFAAALAMATLLGAPAHAALLHSYDFTNDLTDSLGGAALTQSFTAGGSGAAAGGLYTFSAGGGLALLSELPGAAYTIEMRVSLDQIGGYRKLVSFENITSDLGLYNLTSQLNLFNVAGGPANQIAAGTFFDVVISRTAAGQITASVDGAPSFTYFDSTNLFTAANALYFVRDDLAQNAEQSSGVLDYLRIFNDAPESAVPEPASWAMLIAGFGLVGSAMRRRTMTTRVAFA